MVPQSTPIEALFMETGLFDITTIIKQKKQIQNGKKNCGKNPQKI